MQAQASVTVYPVDPVEMAFVTQANPVLPTVVPVITPLLCAAMASATPARSVTWTVQVYHLNNLQMVKVLVIPPKEINNPKSALIQDVSLHQ